jgi:hypothetical protein
MLAMTYVQARPDARMQGRWTTLVMMLAHTKEVIILNTQLTRVKHDDSHPRSLGKGSQRNFTLISDAGLLFAIIYINTMPQLHLLHY